MRLWFDESSQLMDFSRVFALDRHVVSLENIAFTVRGSKEEV